MDSSVVRSHLEALSARGVGLRAVAAATDIPRSTLKRARLGMKLRRSQIERVLATDEQVASDYAVIDAAETNRLIVELLEEGYTNRRLAVLVGHEAEEPSLRRRARVLAKTAHAIRKLHAALLAEGEDMPTIDEVGPRETILAAIRHFDEIRAEELFDSMGIEKSDRDKFMQALHRAYKAGDVERVGTIQPYLYRIANVATAEAA